MPTEIRIVLPDTGLDDSASVATDADLYDSNVNSIKVNGNYHESDDIRNEKCFMDNNNPNDISAQSSKEEIYNHKIVDQKEFVRDRKYESCNHHDYDHQRQHLLQDQNSTQTGRMASLQQHQHQRQQQHQHHHHHHQQQQQQQRHQHQQQARLHLLDGDLVSGQGSRVVILDKVPGHRGFAKKPSSVGNGFKRKLQRPKTAPAKSADRSKGFYPSVTDTYDVDLEHQDIMMKALQSYSQHRDTCSRSNYSDSNRNISQNGTPLWDDRLKHLAQDANESCSEEIVGPHIVNRRFSNVATTSGVAGSTFKLAQCRLHYYDEDDDSRHKKRGASRKKKLTTPKTRSPSPSATTVGNNSINYRQRPKSARPAAPTVLYPMEERDGVLVDSVGHVYRSSLGSRPRSALPCKFTDFVKLSGRNFSWDRSEKNTDASKGSNSPAGKQNTSRPQSGTRWRSPLSYSRQLSHADSEDHTYRGLNRPSTPGNGGKAAPLRLEGTSIGPRATRNSSNIMSGQQHIPHSVAFNRRNRTTHAWGDSSCLSQSLPTSSFLQRYQYGSRSHGSSTASSPRSSRGDASVCSERTSPAGKPSTSKPSASYSYDGGFFVGAHSGQAEYFVIHPDWVSEVMTINKLSVNDGKGGKRKAKGGPPLSHSASFRPKSFQGRRCLSAPPEKRRNPITWDPGFLADASNFDACTDSMPANAAALVANGDK